MIGFLEQKNVHVVSNFVSIAITEDMGSVWGLVVGHFEKIHVFQIQSENFLFYVQLTSLLLGGRERGRDDEKES